MAKITADICKKHEYRDKITAAIHTPKRAVIVSICVYIVTINISLKTITA